MKRTNPVALAVMISDDELFDDVPISVLSITYCDDAYFG